VESLARLAVIIFLALLGAGPLGILAVKCNYTVVGVLLGAASLFSGLWWLIGVPSAPPLLGLWAVGAGAYALYLGGRAYR
jgi:hypothetical protein